MKNKNKSIKNFKNYLKGLEPLRYAILQHPQENEDSSIISYIEKNTSKSFIKPYKEWKKSK